eukprot:3447177-Pyramimonas_sp.AAC.1
MFGVKQFCSRSPIRPVPERGAGARRQRTPPRIAAARCAKPDESGRRTVVMIAVAHREGKKNAHRHS